LDYASHQINVTIMPQTMKKLTEQNYYELLDITPLASPQEVRNAYDQAINIFSADSIPTYSLLSQKERAIILERLVNAYKTLVNSQLRAEYNRSLIEKGELSPEEIGVLPLDESNAATGKLSEVMAGSLLHAVDTQESARKPSASNLDLFDINTTVTGKSIQELRVARDISIEEINRKTNIPKKTLKDIEEERFEDLPALVYLKGFLKAYAKILNANEAQMMDGYVRRFLEWKTTSQK
jgi:curved DNA-binding protein CbpA